MFTQNNLVVNCLPGTIVAFPNTVSNNPNDPNFIPGWAWCNGDTYDTDLNPNLYVILGTNILPNLKGAFLRGSGNNSSYIQYIGPNIKTIQNDTLKGHTHTKTDTGHTHKFYDVGTSASNQSGPKYTRVSTTYESTLSNTDGKVSGISLLARGDNETKPLSYSINWIIKLG